MEVGVPVDSRTTPPPKLNEREQAAFIEKVKTLARSTARNCFERPIRADGWSLIRLNWHNRAEIQWEAALATAWPRAQSEPAPPLHRKLGTAVALDWRACSSGSPGPSGPAPISADLVSSLRDADQRGRMGLRVCHLGGCRSFAGHHGESRYLLCGPEGCRKQPSC